MPPLLSGIRRVPQGAPTRLDPADEDGVRAAMPRVLASDRWVLGPEVAAFEAAWASYLGAAHALLVLAGQPWRPRTD